MNDSECFFINERRGTIGRSDLCFGGLLSTAVDRCLLRGYWGIPRVIQFDLGNGDSGKQEKRQVKNRRMFVVRYVKQLISREADTGNLGSLPSEG